MSLVWLLYCIISLITSPPPSKTVDVVSLHYQRCYQQLARDAGGSSNFYKLHQGPVELAPPSSSERPKSSEDLEIAMALAGATTLVMLCSPLACWWAYRERLETTTLANCWGGGHFSALRWGGFLGAKLAAFLVVVPLFGLLRGQPKNLSILLLQLGATLALILAYRVVHRMLPAETIDSAEIGTLKKLGFALATFSLVCAGNFAISWVQNYLGFQSQSSNPLLAMVINSSGMTLALWVLVLTVLGPLAEELWYRAMLLPALGLLLSSLLFALVHSDPRVFLPLAWTGFMFGWAYRRGGLLSSWLAHALWNGLVTLTLLGARSAFGGG